jgi:ABC-type sugar transport system permease subunit/ABC-type glycerol-3-phosphate transport system substrate-binding protein
MKRLLRLLPVLALAVILAGCGRHDTGKVKLIVWGMEQSDESQGQDAAVEEFMRRHPNIDVRLLSMGAGEMNPQKLMTSIAGNVPPDVVRQDRFTIGDWASRDAFRALDDLIARDRIKAGDFYHACWQEALYRGRVYAIPYGTDDRALYWNRDLFRKAGLDPDKPPRTWSELVAYAKLLTKRRPDGSFDQIGFIPNYGQGWMYLWSWQMDGEFMSRDGAKCTLDNPRTRQALEWVVSVYDLLGGADAINAFSSTFLGDQLDPFYTGKVAMKIDGNWVLNSIARWAPHLDFAVAPAPVPDARLRREPPFNNNDPAYITWSGGFSLAIPRGSPHVEEAWEFIKWMTGVESNLIANREQRRYNLSIGRPFVPNMSANIPADEAVFKAFAPEDPKFREPLRLFMDMMDVSKFRPVTFVGQRLWDEHVRAFETAIYHKKTPDAALRDGQAVVQSELNKVFEKGKYPLLDWRGPIALIAGAFLLMFGIVYRAARRSGPVGKLMRAEAISGYVFASPWMIGFLVFTIGPILVSVVLSFTDYDVLHAARFVGWANYRNLFGDDWSYVWKALTNAAFLAGLGIPLGMMTGLAIAMLLNTRVMGMSWYRTFYYLPAIVPTVASAVLWLWVLNPYDYGLVNAGWKTTLTSWFGLQPPTWLSSEKWAKPGLVLMGLWGAGGGMIIWLAGLQGIPQHLYEAAEIDGAGLWHKFRHVTLPMLSPTIFFVMIMGTIGALQTFETVYVMTGGVGGPVDATLVPVLYLFNNAFRFFKMGYASALAWLLFWIIMFFTLVQLKLAPRWVHYEGR